MTHEEFVSKYKSKKIKVHVSKIDAGAIVRSGIMPSGYFYNDLIWSWLWILSFPTSIAVFIWIELWIGIIILAFGLLLPGAQRKTNCQCIIWHSLDNELFFNLILDKEVIVIEEV